MKRIVLAAAAFLMIGADNPLPYRIWWSFPNDDDTAIEVDDPDLTESTWTSRWQFAVDMQKCDARKSKRLAQHKDGTPVREIRVESLQPDGTTRATSRCVLALREWRTRIGRGLVDRLDDELDAHAAFLMPRHFPGSAPFDAGVVPESRPLKVIDGKPGKAPVKPRAVKAEPPAEEVRPPASAAESKPADGAAGK